MLETDLDIVSLVNRDVFRVSEIYLEGDIFLIKLFQGPGEILLVKEGLTARE